jgi:hypothetical protein
MPNVAVPDSFKDASEFLVTIYWIGDEDKPFYRARLVSASQSARIRPPEPFWGYAVISRREFQALLAALARSGPAVEVGTFDGEAQQYIAEIQAADHILHWRLGANRRTLTILQEIEQSLRPENRDPIRKIIQRATALFAMRKADAESGNH